MQQFRLPVKKDGEEATVWVECCPKTFSMQIAEGYNRVPIDRAVKGWTRIRNPFGEWCPSCTAIIAEYMEDVLAAEIRYYER